MLINIPEKFKQENRDRIVRRRTFNAVTRSSQRSDKGKINQRGDHFCIPTLDISVGYNFHKPICEPVIGKKNKTWKRFIIGC